MKHNKALERQKFDSRLINWNIKRGVITEKEYQEHLKTLSDSSDKARPMDIDVEEDTTLN
ncbi:MAG: hypothetical protein KDD37_06460 [Bdellovibrionales bacterium]|nr:hypothetical protein [Bdellovibrionales bacterium]